MAESISSTSSSCRLDDSVSHSNAGMRQEYNGEPLPPTLEEINEYAKTIGIDPATEPHLLHIAREGLMRPLPATWQLCSADEIGDPYYYNVKTNSMQREHPLLDYYRQMAKQERECHDEFMPITPTIPTRKVNVFARSEPTKNSVKAKASLWDQAFDDVYNKVIQQEKPKPEPKRKLATPTEEATEAMETVSTAAMAATASSVPAPITIINTTTTTTSTTSSVNCASEKSTPKEILSNPREYNLEVRASPIIDNDKSRNGFHMTGAIPKQPNGFSGTVNRFLETRSKNFPTTVKVKSSGKVQTGFDIKAGNEKYPVNNKKPPEEEDPFGESNNDRKGFTLSGTGAMFLKSRRHFGITSSEPPVNYNVVVEGEVGTPPGYKSILRETGLAEVKRRWQREFVKSDLRTVSDSDVDDKKNVRFNLEAEGKIPSSSEEELNAEMSSESDDEVDIDPWADEELDDFDDLEHDDDNEEVNACVGIGTLPTLDGVNYQRSLNPFLINDEKHLKDIKVIPVSKTQTIQMLKAQSFSIHMKAKENESKPKVVLENPEASNAATTAVQYLEKIKVETAVKPMYDDTDSDSKGSSGHSIVVNKPENANVAHSPSNNPFDLDEMDRRHSFEVEQLQKKIDEAKANEVKPAPRSFKVASKLVGFLRKDNDKQFAVQQAKDNESDDNSFELDNEKPLWLREDGYESECPANNPFDLEELGRKHSRDVEQLEKKIRLSKNEKPSMRSFKVASKLVNLLKKDSEKAVPEPIINQEEIHDKSMQMLKETLEKKKQLWLKDQREKLEEKLQQEISNIKKEHEQKLKNIRHEYDLRSASYRHQTEESLDLQLAEYRQQLEEEYDEKRNAVVDEHKAQMATVQKNHAEILEELERDLKSEEEMVKKEHVMKLQQMKEKLKDDLEAERQRIKESGEERLYEKVRCEKRLLEDKYRCLKEKYARLKTEVKLSVERRNRRREAQALQQKNLHTTTTGSETERSTSHRPPSTANSEHRCSSAVQSQGSQSAKPPLPSKTHLISASKETTPTGERSSERVLSTSSRKMGVSPKYARHLKVQDDTTSVSQSDTTISNNYPKGRYLLSPAPPHSDNGNSDSEAFASNVENNNNSRRGSCAGPQPQQPQQRKKQFTRLKSASTSRLNTENFKNERPCTPVENLRHQLQKLEDLEDQLPDTTLDATYHLRYPFSDISNADYAVGSSSELEFFKHRIHLERDSVRRAKESLRSQRTTFRARQREIKQRHNTMATRHSIEQLIQEEKDLTEMEVTLHRTRALLGEKVIRLRHLEQSVMRICDKSGNKASMDLLSVEPKEDATLSDLSSQSSSGFSSTDLASGDTQNLNKRREFPNLESNECIKNLEILNAEIREILDLLGRGGQPAGLNIPMIPPAELNWSHMMSGGAVPPLSPTPDRMEAYRHLTSGNASNIDRMQNSIMAAKTIASKNPKAINYTNSLVERTRDIRNWLKQAKNEHELTSPKAMGATSPLNGGQLTPNTASGSDAMSPLGARGPSPTDQ